MTTTGVLLFAQQQVDDDKVSAGPIGLLIVLLMAAATVFLIRNMNGRLKRLPPSFPSAGERPPTVDEADMRTSQDGPPPQAGPPPGT